MLLAKVRYSDSPEVQRVVELMDKNKAEIAY
jgi:hypothetical protein